MALSCVFSRVGLMACGLVCWVAGYVMSTAEVSSVVSRGAMML